MFSIKTFQGNVAFFDSRWSKKFYKFSGGKDLNSIKAKRGRMDSAFEEFHLNPEMKMTEVKEIVDKVHVKRR